MEGTMVTGATSVVAGVVAGSGNRQRVIQGERVFPGGGHFRLQGITHLGHLLRGSEASEGRRSERHFLRILIVLVLIAFIVADYAQHSFQVSVAVAVANPCAVNQDQFQEEGQDAVQEDDRGQAASG